MKLRANKILLPLTCLLCCYTSALLAISPQQTLLMEGNKRYVQGCSIHPREDMKTRDVWLTKQAPLAIIVGCCDSRVPPEIIFDQGIGDLFVIRVAGNIVGPIELDSIKFAAIDLKTPLIVVLGHEDCAAVHAVLEGKGFAPSMENISPFLQSAIFESMKLPGHSLTNAIDTNVRLVVEYLKTSAPLAELVKKNKLDIVGARYDFHEGKVLFFSHDTKK